MLLSYAGDGKAAPRTLPFRLVPQHTVLGELQAAQPKELGEALLRRRRAVDPEFQRLPGGLIDITNRVRMIGFNPLLGYVQANRLCV